MTDTRSVEEVIARALAKIDHIVWDRMLSLIKSNPNLPEFEERVKKWRADAVTILAALKDEGMVVVPKDDTPKMNERGYDALSLAFNWSDVDGETMCKCVSDVYRAMISAAEDQHGDKQ